MGIARIPLILVSFWKPKLCKYFYFYQCLQIVIRETLVIERGQCHHILIMTEFWSWYASFGCGNLRTELVATVLTFAYIFLFVENELYRSESPTVWPSFIRFFVSSVFVVFNQTIVGFIITNQGRVYIDAKIPYESSQ